MMRRQRRMLQAGAAVLVLCAGFAALTGWFSPKRPWQEVCGADRLAEVPRYQPGDGPKILWLGHAGFLIQWHGQCLAVDPNLSATCFPVPRLVAEETPAWPAPVTLALISHAHYDHFDLPSLRQLPGLQTLVAPSGLNQFLDGDLADRLHFEGLRPGESLHLGRLKISAVETRHNGGRNHPLPSDFQALGFVIGDGQVNLYFAGDSGYGPHFRSIGQRFHPKLAILPIGAYAPHFALGPHHLDPEEAVQAGIDLGVELVIPSHFGTFRLAFDAPDAALPRFAAAAQSAPFRWAVARAN